MVNGITWEEETLARAKEARTRQKQAEDTARQAQDEATYWGQLAETLGRAVELSRERRAISPNGHDTIDAEHLRQQSTWKNLVEIASSKDGLLSVVDAVTILVTAKVFADREHARNVIYSTLYSHKHNTQKVRRGIYRLDVRHGIRTSQKGIPGLKQAIIELKTVNPDMTKQDVRDTLIKRAFNFQGKSPGRAVHLAWVNMGYAKKEKQPAMQLLTADEILKERR